MLDENALLLKFPPQQVERPVQCRKKKGKVCPRFALCSFLNHAFPES
jgi:hypothetical protein